MVFTSQIFTNSHLLCSIAVPNFIEIGQEVWKVCLKIYLRPK